ncbi:MAG: glycosyltransferase family A protein [Cyanobacteria bacterium J06627_32]
MLEVALSESRTRRTIAPAVTVIIPAYNAMRYLPRTLHSVLNQTYQNFSVVIVDDGSQDGLSAWYRQLSVPVKSRVRLLSQPRQGTAGARNAGLACSCSPYVAFLDADDLWLPEKLARQIAFLEASPAVSLVYCWAAAIDSDGHWTGHLYTGHLYTGHLHAGYLHTGRLRTRRLRQLAWANLVVRNEISTPSTVLARRSCLETVGGFDPMLHSYVEDKDLWLRIASNYQIGWISEVLVHKRRHSLNTSKQWHAMEKAGYQVLEKAFASPPSAIAQDQLIRLRRRSHAELNCLLAWKPLQTNEVDVQAALNYLLGAWRYLPSIVFSKESCKLILVMGILTIVGVQRYRLMLRLVAKLRYWLSSIKTFLLRVSLCRL